MSIEDIYKKAVRAKEAEKKADSNPNPAPKRIETPLLFATKNDSDSAATSPAAKYLEMTAKRSQEANALEAQKKNASAASQAKKWQEETVKRRPEAAALKKKTAEKELAAAEEQLIRFDQNHPSSNVAYSESLLYKPLDAQQIAERDQLVKNRENLQKAADMAGSELAAAANQRIMAEDVAVIDAMSEAERESLRQYVESNDATKSVYTNPLIWFQENKKMSEAAKALELKYGKDRAAQLRKSYSRYLHEQEAQKVVEDTRASVDSGGAQAVGQHVIGLLTRNLGGVDATVGRIGEMLDRDQRYSTYDPYNTGDLMMLHGSTVTSETAQNIAGDKYDENGQQIKEGGALRQLASYGYQGVSSLADSLFRAAAGGDPAGAAALAAANSFSQTVSEASQNGASKEQAVMLGGAIAGIEYLSEKLPMDEVFRMAKGGNTHVVVQALKQAGIEATTEDASLICSMAAEAAILREKSSYNQQIGDLVAGGMSYQDAKKQADKAVLEELKQTTIVSGFSGAVSGGGGSIFGNLKDHGSVFYKPGAVNVDQSTNLTPNGPVAQEQPNQTYPMETVAEQLDQRSPQELGQQDQLNFMDSLLDGVEDKTPAPEPMPPAQENLNKAAEATFNGTPVDTAYISENSGGNTLNQKLNLPNAAASSQQPTSETLSDSMLGAPSTDRVAQSEGIVNQDSSGGGQRLEAPDGIATGEVRQSNTFTNSGIRNADENISGAYKDSLKNDPTAAEYRTQTHEDTRRAADARTASPEKMAAEKQNILNADHWTAVDNIVCDNIMQDAFHSDDPAGAETFAQMAAKRKAMNTEAGRLIESNKMTMRAAEDTATASATAIHGIEDLTPETSTFKQKKGGPSFEDWKKQTETNIARLGMAVESVPEGDSAAMRDAITQIAKRRNTTAWFGTADRLSVPAAAILKKLDFADLKKVANCQIAAMADDYRARTKMEVASGLRKNSMLSSLATFNRNLSGNSATGIMDSFSDSTSGRLADLLLSKITGKRTVGNDMKYTKEYFSAAKDAAKMASLCVELNIPIETSIDGSLGTSMGGDGKYIGRTFRSNGNPAMRALYAYQKYMSYALEVSDKFFEGGTNAAIRSSLEAINNSGLTLEEVDALSDKTAARRTFKDDGVLANAASSITNGLNFKNKDGKTVLPLGDIANPFVKVPMNVAQVGIDYTAGTGKGLGEIIKIMDDARKGKDIDVARQRQAATDFGRGVTGAGMIAMFTAAAAKGIIRVTREEDKNKQAAALSEGRSNAQINLDAMLRGLSGGDMEWQDGDDHIVSLDFLEPFNTQIYLGYELSQDEGIMDMLKHYPEASLSSIANSIADSPMMTGPTETFDTLKSLLEDPSAENMQDELASYAGDLAGSYIPQFVGQAAYYTDGYYRDTTGDTPAQAAMNQVKARIPGLSQSLPIKYDGFGNPQERPGGLFDTFVNPTKTNTYKQNEIIGYLDGLSGRTGQNSIYPERQAPKSFSYRDSSGEKQTITVSGKEMTETYQKAYGDRINALYGEMIQSEEFAKLPDEAKTKAFEKAKSYAKEFAQAAVSDFDQIQSGTDQEIAKQIVRNSIESTSGLSGTNYDDAVSAGYSVKKMQDISRVNKGINSVFSDFNKAWENGEEATDTASLAEAYASFDALPKDQQEFIAERLEGRAKNYLVARKFKVSDQEFLKLSKAYYDISHQDGMSSAKKAQQWSYTLDKAREAGEITGGAANALRDEMTFHSGFTADDGKYGDMVAAGIKADDADMIVHLLDGITGTGSVDKVTGKANVTDSDKYKAIAGSGLPTSEIDMIMKAYMPDYNPRSTSPITTELKYDYGRKKMGLTPQQYIEALEVSKSGNKAEKLAKWQAMGYTREQAMELYNLLYATGKNKIDVKELNDPWA